MQLKIRLDLTSERVQESLLDGLDIWVRLGLLSETQIRELATTLTEPVRLPEPETGLGTELGQAGATEAVGKRGLEMSAVKQTARRSTAPITDFVNSAGNSNVQDNLPAPASREPSLLSQAVRSLLDEISVIWLLFLGVFLVIVSSGVLAASQWQSFSPVGQYVILLTYTLAFWGASVWAQRQARLQTTASMLALTTLLLIPVNFWMMDALGVLDSPIGVGVGGLAAIALSVLPFKLLTHRSNTFRSNTLNLVALSWLHWGWGGWPLGWPLVATYIGTVGTAINLTYQDRQSARRERGTTAAAESATPPTASAEIELKSETPQIMSFDSLVVALSVLILLTRSAWIAQVPPHQLGLAAGICGWLLVWLTRQKTSQPVWSRVGLGLLLIGWAVSVGHEPPWQAIGVSGLALWLIWDRLRIHWLRDHLLMLLGVSFQAYWLLWFTLPPESRASFLTGLSNQFAPRLMTGSEWASLGLFPFVIGLLLFAWQLRQRWAQRALAHQTEIVALGLGVMLSLLSLGNSFSAGVNLSLSTVTLAGVLRYRAQVLGPPSRALIALTHGVGLLALTAWIYHIAPDLSLVRWAYVGLGIAIAEFFVHLILRSNRWQLSTWHAGLIVAAIDYGLLLLTWRDQPQWVWLTVPIALTLVANHRRALHPQAAVGATMAALVMQTPWLIDWEGAIASFAIGTLCMGLNSRIWRNDLATLFTVASAIGWATSSFGYRLPGGQGQWLIFWAAAAAVLGLLPRLLNRREGELARLYSRATQTWGIVLMVGLLLTLTLLTLTLLILTPTAGGFHLGVESVSGSFKPYLSYGFAAALLLVITLGEAIYHRPAEWRFWSLAWATELVIATGLLQQGIAPEGIARSTLGLGLIAQILADLWVLKQQRPYRVSWHGIPIAYGLLGWLLGHIEFQADTGLYTLTAAVIFIGVGRRQPTLHPLSYLGLATLSLGAYELLIYRLLQASGGQAGDGITLLAGLALGIALVERLLGPWLLRYLQTSPTGLRLFAQGHWAAGSLLALGAGLDGLSQPNGIAIWTGVSLLLAGYALLIGNHRWTPQTVAFNHTTWTALGLLEAVLAVAYDRFAWFADQLGLLTWGGVIACAIGFALYRAPWTQWGWPMRPWRLMGVWLPILTLSITLEQVSIQGLLIVGAFYAWMGKQFEQIRLSYLSVLLLDWAVLRYLNGQGWLTILWCNLILGLSVLYAAEVDPYFRPASNTVSKKQQRHWLRTLVSGLVGLTALYQAEISDPILAFAGLTLLLGLGFIFAGLILKVRAFLYGGTVTFILQIMRVLWLFISTNSLMLWAIGIVLGLAFIWIAATFESRRSQVINLLGSWASALATWD